MPLPQRKRTLLTVIGPGLLVAATGVGTGDLATAGFAGSKLGVAVLWAVVLGAFVKYVLNEGLARWQLARVVAEFAVLEPDRWLCVPFVLQRGDDDLSTPAEIPHLQGEERLTAFGTLVGDRNWHHVTAVLRPFDLDEPHVSDIELYADGQRQGIYKLSETTVDTGDVADVRVGASHYPQSESYFDGIIDDVRIYPSALSLTNIQSIYIQAGWP